MSSVRQQIIEKIAAGLAGIQAGDTVVVDSRDSEITHTYSTTFAVVREHNQQPWSEDELPAISFGEVEANLEFPQGDHGLSWHNLILYVQIFVAETDQGAHTCRSALHDVIAWFASQKRRIGGPRLDGLADSMRMLRNRLDLSETGQWLGSGSIQFQIRYYQPDSTL